MRIASVAIALLFAICLAVLTACGGDGEGDLGEREVGDELERALQSVVENDLAIMVLPPEELGEEFADLEIDDDSGFRDNEETADHTIDPDDTADELERAGRINGYLLGYEAPDFFSVLEAGEGVTNANQRVHLFKDASTASDYVAKQVDDWQRLQGEEYVPGGTVEEVETFEVRRLGDEAAGLTGRVSMGDAQGYGTGVYCRLGRLVGEVWIARADDADVNSQVEAIARALEERMEGVLLGDIGGLPVPVPQAEEEATAAPPSDGGPDLAEMALSLDDLPAGVSIDHEGYVEDEDTVASYEREFDLGFVTIGSSRPMSLESEIDLYENTREAAAEFVAYEFAFTSESAPDFLASYLGATIGFEPTNVQIESLPPLDLDDESLAVGVSLDTPLGSLEVILVYVRVDRAVGMLTLVGLAGNVDSIDAISLAEAMAARMAEEL